MAESAVQRVHELTEALRAGDRAALARAITLVESRRHDHRELAKALLADLATSGVTAPDPTEISRRIGISGVPGVGKSTLIEALGLSLIAAGHRVAVLAIDPSSRRTGGSILGDRTRMGELATHSEAFVRPSPSGGTLGGVASATREAILLCEAAGFDVVLVETVGVGQSEYLVADLVDSFLFLTLARTGDQLQGMKRGILELADVVSVNKADGDHVVASKRAALELKAALRLVGAADGDWQPPVLTCSAVTGEGLAELWQALESHRAHLADGLVAKRREQQVYWSRALVREALLQVTERAEVLAVSAECEAAVRRGDLGAAEAAQRILAAIAAL